MRDEFNPKKMDLPANGTWAYWQDMEEWFLRDARSSVYVREVDGKPQRFNPSAELDAYEKKHGTYRYPTPFVVVDEAIMSRDSLGNPLIQYKLSKRPFTEKYLKEGRW